jgi:hypothetical protein
MYATVPSDKWNEFLTQRPIDEENNLFLWSSEDLGDGYVRFVNRGNETVTSANRGSTREAAPLALWPWQDSSDQWWRIEPVEDSEEEKNNKQEE